MSQFPEMDSDESLPAYYETPNSLSTNRKSAPSLTLKSNTNNFNNESYTVVKRLYAITGMWEIAAYVTMSYWLLYVRPDVLLTSLLLNALIISISLLITLSVS